MEDKNSGVNPVGAAPAKPSRASTDDGITVLSYILSGILLYGGLGWAGAHYLHQEWMLPTGLILGFLASMYLIIKRYGSTTR